MDLASFMLNIAAATGTVVAVYLAVIAYRQASRAHSDAARSLVMERRLAYELDLLRDLADQFVGGPNRDGWLTRMRVMLLTLPGDEDLPLLRALTGARPRRDAEELLAKLEAAYVAVDPVARRVGLGMRWQLLQVHQENGRVLAEVEIEEAIARRLTVR